MVINVIIKREDNGITSTHNDTIQKKTSFNPTILDYFFYCHGTHFPINLLKKKKFIPDLGIRHETFMTHCCRLFLFTRPASYEPPTHALCNMK